MTITTLLERLGTAGIRLRVHDGELRVVGNRAALDPETVGQLREHKAALLEIVGGHGWGARGGGPCIHELFEAQVERTPDAAALLCGDRSLSYAELNAGANQLAHHLRDLGVGPDSRVGICLEPGPEMMVGVFGVLKAGGAYVPLDPSYPEERLGYMLRDSAPVVLLTRASLEDRFAGTGPSMLDVGAQEPAWTGAPRTNPERGRVGLTPRHLAYVIYTSGSTGRPKGVRVEHGSLVSTLVAAREAFGFGPTDRVHALASFAFDIWLFESLLPLLAGSGVRLVTREEVLDVPRLVAELSGCTAVHAVPALMRRIVQEVRAAPEGTLPAVRRVFVGGDAVAPELLAEMRAVFPAAQVHVLYGPTEGTIICAAHRASPEAAWRQMVGRPLGNAALYVLDAEGSAALVGAPGEICLGGGSVARDYLGRPELTAERFVPDPFGKEPGGRLYRTGDQGRWLPDGSIEFLGRNDAQVKVRGFRIELGEVEARLLEHPGLREAVVVAREDDAGEKRLVAYWAGPDEVRADGLRAYLAERLPEYMVPAAYVRLEVLPLTPNGKLDRRALPAPEGDAYARRGYEAPQGEVEQALAEIWAEVLKVERVGRSDHFFELGGHSLLAVQVASRVRQRLGAEVPLGEVFRVPVLAEYARTVAAAARADLPPIEPAERTAPLPLSFAQQRLWFLEQMGGLGNAYHIPWRLRLRGELDRAALRQALDRIVARHEALRTSFSVAGGEPVQRITPSEESRFPLAEHDLRGAAEPEEELRRLLSQEWSTLFDLERGPLIRGCLVRLGEEEHALQVIMHHVVADGWSMGVFTRELSALYAAFRSGEADPLPELPVQYADYAVWQRRWVEGEVLRQQAEYWKRTLAGAPELLELPADRPRPAQQDFAGAALGVVLDEELTAGLKVLSQRQGTTLFMTLLAGWAVVLSRLSGQEDLVVGTPTANRGRREIEGLIGFFVNTLALRVDLSGAPTVAELLERVRERALEAQQNQDIPFEQVVEAVRPARSLAHTPLFQVTLAWQNAPGGELELPGLTRVGAGGAEQVSAKYDLSLSLGESEGRIVGGAQYAASLFGRGTMERYLGYLRRVLEEMAAGPERPVAGLEMLPEEERQQVVERWNATEAPYPRELCVHQLFEAQARRSPDAVALVFAGEALSYAELNARANRLAHHLVGLGVGPEARVAVCVERSAEMVVALLAVLKAGGAFVPLDPEYPPERLGYMLRDSAPAAVLTQGPLLERLAAAKVPELAGVPVLDLAGDAAAWARRPESDPARGALSPEHLAYVIYTSGSTGRPKGVMVPHRALVNFLDSMRVEPGLAPSDTLLAVTTLSFDIAGLELFLPLSTGARVALAARETAADGAGLREALAATGATLMQATPATWQMLLEAGWEGTQGLRVLCGGEALPRELAGRLLARCSALWNLYGPTETTVWSTALRVEAGEGAVPIGRPIANTTAYLLDGELRPVPLGAAGELYLGGDGVTRGYLGRPELTAERFVPDPFARKPGVRLYRTGDRVLRRADGALEFVGRSDHQVKVRGYRIEPGEVEARLLEHPEVHEAVVVAREDEPGDKRLVAYYVAPEAIRAESLRAHLLERVPEYMAPAAYVCLEEMPLTPNGKLDRRALPAPEGEAYARRGYEAPQGEVEEAVAEIWAEVLRLERVGRWDHFFELGGHSLLAVRVVSRVRQRLGVEVPVGEVFRLPVLAEYARAVAEAARADLPPIEPVERTAPLPLSFAQQRLWFLERLGGLGNAYHVPWLRRLRGELDREALRRALERIVARHEVLRTTFPLVDGQPVQRIAPAEEWRFRLTERDLSARPQSEVRRVIAEEAGAPFDLERGPLVRGCLVRLGEDEHALQVTMHHVVSDGWSMGVLTRELNALYDAFRSGEADPLPELPVQYADYAVWQRRWVEGEVLRQQAEYWKRTLSGAPELLELPADRPRPAQQDFAGAALGVVLDEELTAGLKALSRRRGTTLFMTLLAGWAAVLSRLSGQEDLVVGTPTANRGQAEVEGLIGFFVNTLALRLDLSGGPTVGELLERVRERALEAQQNQDIPFEQVVEAVRPARSLAHTPLFQVMLAWQNATAEELALPGLALAGFGAGGQPVSAKYDLSLWLGESEGRITGGLTYTTSLYERATVERHLGYLRRVLEGMAAGPERRVAGLEMLPEAERRQVVEAWNATQAPYPAERCIHELFEAQAERTPDAVAVVFEGEQVSYAELNARANRLAHHLVGLGVGPDARVAVCLERSPELVAVLLAVLKAGGAYVPLDPSYPQERLKHMLADSGPLALLTREDLRDRFEDPDVPVLDVAADAALWAGAPDANPERVGLTPEHLCYVIYTSGSTGRPKGVMNAHRGVVNRLHWMETAHRLAPDEAVLQKTPYSFDVSVWEFFWPLAVGARLVLARPEGHRDTDYLVETIRSRGITTVHFVPSMLGAFLEHPEVGMCTGLRRVVCSGEALPPALVERFGERLPEAELHNLYGPTEAAVDVTAWRCPTDGSAARIPIGAPVANTRMYVLDPSGAPAPAGVAGELHIGGVQVARGYLGRAELTAERFVPDPFSGEAGARLYRTGDVGRWLPDGAIEYLGRNDHQVKVRGFRLEPGEIEACLAEHPGVREAVVLARADGAGDRRLVAYLVGEGPLEPEALRRSLQERLPEHMVPAAYVRLEKLPLTPSGKLDRGALPAPDGEAYARRGYEAPVGEVEQALAEIWAELLGVERVGRNDHFFELGGHSLLAVTLIERMRQRGLHADVRALFTTPRLEDYAAGVDGRSREVEVPPNRIPPECRALVPEMLPLVELEQEEIDRIVAGVPGGAANVQDIYPLAPLQEGILFHHLMTTEGDPYLTSFLTAFDGRERLDAYLGALQAVVQRHDILRTSVVWEGLRQPVQVVWRTAPLLVEEVALGPGDDDPGRQLYRRVAPRRHRIDVTRAPLLRLHLAHDEARGRWFLLMLLHHLADDNTSLRFLHAEIEAHLLGCESELPAPMPFRNYVAQTRRRGSAEEQEAFFRGLLGDVSAPTAPFGLVDARGDGSRAAEARLTLDDGLSRRLRERARALGVSAASLFHVAWAQVLARVSGRMDVVFGTVLFGRMQGGAGSDRVMGPFINTLPVRLRIGEEGVEATVRRMHGLLAELLRHEHASLAVAQRCSGVEPPTPLFTALLNYRNRGGPTRTVERPQAWEGITRVHSEERSNYPLSLSVDDLGEGFKLVAEAHASVVPGRVCRLVQVALERLVEALEAAPTAAVRSLEVLPEEERRQVLEEWNATAAEYPRDACVHELFQAHVKRAPDAVAVVCGAEELSYAELNARANRLAHHLRARGVGPDARVAICAERSPEMIVGLFGILKAGGAYVPLDPAHPRERLREVLQDSRPVAVLTQGQLRPLFAGFHLPVIDVDAAAEWSSLPPTDPVRGELSPEHLAYVIYTSGSTGRPKGVMIQHRSVCQQADALQAGLGIGPGDRNLQFAPVTFDASVEQIFGALLSGAALVLRSDAWLEGARTFWTMCEAHRVSVIDLPARFWQLLAGDPSVPIPDCVRLVEIGGEAVEPAALSDWFRRGGYRPPLHNLYGPTEATVNATHHELTDDSSTWQSIGRPIRNTRVYILDAHGAPVPQGVAGEIHVAGGQVARGYQNLPELTAERFVPDPFGGDPGARLYRTGDLGRWRSDGTIDFLGRTDHQVKIRGYRIELGEIETWLAEHPAVRDAVVLAREDAPGDRRLVAYYVAAQGVEAETLRRHLGERLPEHMVPAAYVRLEEMPLTPNGKVDRRALPAPDGNAYARRGYEAPVGEVERALAEIWAEVLKVERVGRWDNFFELGGHSLLAVQVLGRLHGVLDAPLALADLFSHPTVESLSARVCGSGPELRSDRAIPVRTAGSERPLFLVHEGSGSVAYAQVLHPHIDAGIPVYALPAVSGLEPPLRTVEGMAARLVRMVREVQPEGPYRLAGWSYGGMLAYEMAAQLIGQDQPVEFLGMMDSYYPAAGGSGAGEGRHDYGMLLHMLRMEAGGEGRAPEPGDRELVASRPDLEAFVAGCRERGLLPGHVTAAQAAEMQDRLDVHDRSTRGYRPQPIPLPVHLFSARDGAGADPRRGWQAVLDEASIRVTPVPGTHLSMMEGSNAAAVGRALSHELRRAAAARNALPGERYSPLVTLQRGRLGGGVPTFCVPGAGASVTTFSALAGHLDPAWPVYGLQPRGLDGAMVPHSTVQAAAECCLRAVREVCPEGPVHLVGHSFGGWVAFEMALRLREAGRSPGSLLLLDTEAPDGDGAGIRERDGGEAFLDLVEVLELAMGADFGIAAAEAAALDENGRLKLLHDRMVRHGLMSARLDPTVLQGPFRTFAACARTTYAPSAVYPDRLRLVLLDDPRKDEGANREHFAETVRAWRRWAPGLLVSTGAGNHFTALTPPHVAGLAAHVAADRGAVGSGG